MTIHNQHIIAYPSIAGFQTGTVEEITREGLIAVNTGMTTIVCHFVRNSTASPPAINVGAAVLYVLSASEDEIGYVLGLVEPYQPKADRLAEKRTRQQLQRPGHHAPETTTIEDEVVHIKAHKGLVIECGTGSITITQDGKVQIKGKELLSRARGMSRIKGAGVNIN
ncbi:MAG: hypothetical protein GXP08_05225 [Gammaproteobacteria bacterium]|nr:hypothetical protein [Gammaproteobacteria bacterium]